MAAEARHLQGEMQQEVKLPWHEAALQEAVQLQLAVSVPRVAVPEVRSVEASAVLRVQQRQSSFAGPSRR